MTDEGLDQLKDALVQVETLRGREQYARRVLSTMTLIHALVAIAFGTSLIFSAMAGRESTSAAYALLRAVPGWPGTIGLVFIGLGVVQIYARYTHDKYVLSAWTFVVHSSVSAVYGGLFLIGSISSPAIFGPQVLYFGTATLTGLHALYAFGVARGE